MEEMKEALIAIRRVLLDRDGAYSTKSWKIYAEEDDYTNYEEGLYNQLSRIDDILGVVGQ